MQLAEDARAGAQSKPASYPFAVKPLDALFGAEISGIDLAQPLDAATADAVFRALLEYKVLVFRDQDLTREEQGRFAENYGELESHVGRLRNGKRYPVINDITNVDIDGKLVPQHVNRGPYFWHTDKSYHATPSKITMLHAKSVPSKGGETEFSDMKLAYNVLSDELKTLLDGMKVKHSWEANRINVGMPPATDEQNQERPPVIHPMVRTHPETGEKALYIGTHIDHIIGMEKRESDLFVAKLLEHATQKRFRYDHVWREGDLVMWDNACLMHRGAFNYDMSSERRVLQRTVVIGTVPF
jgi:alpha-ketoglutarate-dependent taurine dioxygenase